jgi:hypothetical protein
MPSRRRFLLASWAILGFTLFLAGWQPSAGEIPAPSPERPRLVVLLVFDQMRADYLTRWQSVFAEGGLRRLQEHGAWFQNCHYPYANTVTAAGHASLLTGCTPAVHSIVGNDWYDRQSARSVYCVQSSRPYEQVPANGSSRNGNGFGKKKGGISPERLLAPTLADVLKEATGGKARVVSLSLKDRSAVLPAGQRPDACYWFNSSQGVFVTSSYYRDRPHPWVEEFNRSRPADRWFGRSWERLRPQLDYELLSGPDDAPGEGIGFVQGKTFPHPLKGGLTKPGRIYYEAVTDSPMGNELLLDLAKRAITAERLGQHETPDLLSVSFSSNDLIGHTWGPDSQEVFDVTLRTDLIVKDLLAHLDAQVGKGRYLLALSADHGVCPLPEVSRTRGEEAGRIDPSQLTKKAGEFLTQTFGAPSGRGVWFEELSYPWIYLNYQAIRAGGKDLSTVENALAGWLKKQPGILTAYTRTQLLKGIPPADKVGSLVRRSFYPDRSGDVVVIQKPYYLFASPLATGTNHGTPHPYDTHVPLLIYGPGVRAGVYQEAVTPQAIAAIFAQRLKIAVPARAEFGVPASLKR